VPKHARALGRRARASTRARDHADTLDRLKSARAAKRGQYGLRLDNESPFHHEIHSIQSLSAAAHLLQGQGYAFAFLRIGNRSAESRGWGLANTASIVNTEWVVVAEPVETRAAQLADLFTSAGFSVQVVRNGDEIAALLERVPPPALLVLHLAIPVVDGLTVLEDLRRSERQIPVLALTSVRKLRDAAMIAGVGRLSVVPSESSVAAVAAAAARLLGRDSLRAAQTQGVKTADRLSAFTFDAEGSWTQQYIADLANGLTDTFETAFAVVGITVGGRTWCSVSTRPLAIPVAPAIQFLEWPLIREASEGRELLVIPNRGINTAFPDDPWPPAGTFQGVAVMPMISRAGTPVGAACLLEFGPLAMDAVKLQTFEARVRAATAEIERALETDTAVNQMQAFRRQMEGQRADAEARIAVLSNIALKDTLTGLFNRRGGEEALTREVARLQRTRARSSVLLLDIDHFKRINDTHGHASGDRVIVEVAHTLQRLQRASDISARWGGEEFLIMLPDNSVDGARAFGERIRATVEAIDFGELGHVTISAGAAEFRADEKPSETIANADHALYAAKAAGGNAIHSMKEHGRTVMSGVEEAMPPQWTESELAEAHRRRERLSVDRPAASETDASPEGAEADARPAAPVAELRSTGPDVAMPARESPGAVDREPPPVPERSGSRQRWIVLGLLAAAIVAGLTYAIDSARWSADVRRADAARQAVSATKDEALRTLERERVAAQAAAERQIALAREAALSAQTIADVLVAPDLLRFDLLGQPFVPRSRGQGLFSRSRGFVFTALQLQPAAAGSAYRLWVLTDDAPVDVGPISPDADGRVTMVMRVAPAVPRRVRGLSLTIEPAGAVTAPTGPVVLTSLRQG
jgi:diguanylate cyclase (GGDEF)-like protein